MVRWATIEQPTANSRIAITRVAVTDNHTEKLRGYTAILRESSIQQNPELRRAFATLRNQDEYVQQSREEMEVLFTLLAERYERGSVLLTSNLPFSKWDGIFKDPMTTAAAIDRLVHH